jgi:hypothetical protein
MTGKQSCRRREAISARAESRGSGKRSVRSRWATRATLTTLVCVVLLLHGTGCGAPAKRDADVIMGGGPTSYWNVDQVLTPSGSLASAVITWPDVRVVRNPTLGEGHQLVRPTQGTCALGEPFPVAVGSGIIAGREQLVVTDGACGVWIADLQDLGQTVPWNAVYEPVLPDFTVSVENADGDGFDDVLFAGTNGFVLCRQTRTMQCWSFPSRGSLVSRVATPLHGFFGVEHGILYQRNEAPELVPIDTSNDEFGPALRLKQRPTEYLRPFQQFDQLATISLSACGAFAIGIGTFDQSARFPTHRPQILSVTAPTEFQASTLPTTLDVVAAMTVVQDSADRAVVVALGKRDGGWTLEAGAARCDVYEALVESDVEFDWAVPLAPAPSTDPNLPHLGLKIVGEWLGANKVGVYHSDGFTLRTFEIDLTARSVTQANFALP